MGGERGLSYRRKRQSLSKYLHVLWLLTKRDLHVRYATTALGYLWSILDPLVMAGIYFVVFVMIFHRSKVGEDPYIVFLLAGLLPWVWFNGAISDCSRAFLRESRLIRSTAIPRTIWVTRIVLSKGIEYLGALPVLLLFVLISHASLTVAIVFLPLALVLQALLTIGVGLIVAPLVVIFRDLERVVALILRVLFYTSPIIYSDTDVPRGLRMLAIFNPLTGIFDLYRSAYFPRELSWKAIVASMLATLIILALGVWVFSRTERNVLKEI
ncbi:MAG: ABC transporter permease [Lacisediminihabitans sp.]